MFTETFIFKKCVLLLFYRMTTSLVVEGLYEGHNVSVSILTKHGPTLSIIRKQCVKVQVYRKIQTAPQRLDIWYYLLNVIFCFLVSIITLDLLWRVTSLTQNYFNDFLIRELIRHLIANLKIILNSFSYLFWLVPKILSWLRVSNMQAKVWLWENEKNFVTRNLPRNGKKWNINSEY